MIAKRSQNENPINIEKNIVDERSSVTVMVTKNKVIKENSIAKKRMNDCFINNERKKKKK